MADLRECFVRGGRAFIDAGDVAAVLLKGDDFDAIRPPEDPLRFLLAGCGDTIDVFGVSAKGLFDWLPSQKFIRLRTIGGHVFLHGRHVVGLVMSGDDDKAASTKAHPLKVVIRGAKSQINGWGLSALDFLYELQQTGREVKVTYLEVAA